MNHLAKDRKLILSYLWEEPKINLTTILILHLYLCTTAQGLATQVPLEMGMKMG